MNKNNFMPLSTVDSTIPKVDDSLAMKCLYNNWFLKKEEKTIPVILTLFKSDVVVEDCPFCNTKHKLFLTKESFFVCPVKDLVIKTQVISIPSEWLSYVSYKE